MIRRFLVFMILDCNFSDLRISEYWSRSLQNRKVRSLFTTIRTPFRNTEEALRKKRQALNKRFFGVLLEYSTLILQLNWLCTVCSVHPGSLRFRYGSETLRIRTVLNLESGEVKRCKQKLITHSVGSGSALDSYAALPLKEYAIKVCH